MDFSLNYGPVVSVLVHLLLLQWVLIRSLGLVGSSIHFILFFKIVLVTLKVSVEFT